MRLGLKVEGSRSGVTKSRTRIKGGAEAKPTPEKEVTGLPLPPRIYDKPETFKYVFMNIRREDGS